MKILYIAQERCAAQVAGRALSRIAPNVRLSWASSPGAAMAWIRDNRDAQAVIAEAGREDPAFDALLEQVRSLGVTAPIAAIAPEHLEALSTALEANVATLTSHDRKRSELLEAQLREIEELRRLEQQRLAESQAQHDAALARTTRICTALQAQLMELEAALHGADARHAAQTAASEQLTRREAELSAAVAEALALRAAVEHRLADAEAAHQIAHQSAVEDLAAASERHAIAEDRLARETTLRSALEERLAAAEIARENDNQSHAAELASLDARFGERAAQHDASVSRLNRICTMLQQRLLELEAALRSAAERQATDTAAIERLIASETEMGAALADALAARSTLADALAEKEAAWQRGAADLALAGQRCSAFEEQVTREATARSILEERLSAADRARQELDQQHATELTSLTTRLDDVEAQHAAAASQNAALEQQLLESAAALEDARREWRSEVVALAERLQLRETELGASLADALAVRAALEERLADAEAMHHQAQQRLATALAEAAEHSAAIEARHSQEISTREALAERLTAAESARHDADRQHAAQLASVSGQLTDLQARHQTALKQRTIVEQELAAAAAALEQSRREWQSEALAAASRHAALEEQLEASGRDIARLRQEAESSRRQLDVMRTRADSLRRHAAQVPTLQVHLERSRKENRRQFERAPYGLAECSRDGRITRVNHSFARLLGYRSSAHLRDMDVVGTAFESPGDLRWLLERALPSGNVESVETTLRTRDLHRRSVRLHAYSLDDSVAIAVEDLTALHEVEQRLREAHRLEAVGRVASEVAVTCDTMLRDVSQGGRQWLDALEGDARFRQQGELLFGDVTRAAGFLRQFAAYGHQEISNVASVNLPRALRDMAPILKRVLGDDIALLLPKATGPLDIDVDAERVERILVNVANYARARMPHGGRVRIQLAAAVVDGQFVASHPKVRPGAHVLVKVEEIQGPVWPALPIGLPIGWAADADRSRSTSERPGIDLGPLVTLIGEVGGHLWVSAEPAGNMTLQMHLPRRTEDESLQPVAAASGRARHFTRWFRH